MIFSIFLEILESLRIVRNGPIKITCAMIVVVDNIGVRSHT